MSAIYWLDIRLLRATQWLMTLCVEWLSWKQRVVERVLIVAYVVLTVWMLVQDQSSPWWLLLFGVIAWQMKMMHQRTDSERFYDLMAGRGALSRTVATILCTMLIPGLLYIRHFVPLAQYWVLVIAVFLLALPESGEQGRRRRAAIQKLTDSYGRALVPASGAA